MIHPTAIVSPDAQIGKNVEIGPYAVIEDNVKIGDNCYIDAHVKICRYTTIGSDCCIYMNALVGAEPQDHRFYRGLVSYCEIGHHTVIREFVTIHRPPFEQLKTVVGNYVLLMAFVHVAHDVVIGDHATIANHTQLSGHVQVGDGAVMSGFVLVHQFCRIGSLAMIAPTSKIFFFEGLNSPHALEQIEKTITDCPEVELFVNFIKQSNRGIMPGNPKYTGVNDDVRDALESGATAPRG